MRTTTRLALVASVALPVALAATVPGLAAARPKHRSTTTDTTAPAVVISSPGSGSTTSGTLSVLGAASDNTGVKSVSVALDGGAWQVASGTTSWSLSLSGLYGGTHSVAARAVDAAGNVALTSVTFTVSTASPAPISSSTPSPSPSPSPSPTTSTTPAPAPTTTSGGSAAPNSQGTWVSPEGVTITISSAGSWTISQVYSLLLANARDLSLIGPSLTVNVQDSYASQTTTSASQSGGSYYGYRATVYLKGVSSTFAIKPDMQLAHEYGHAWTRYWLYAHDGGSWSSYLSKRWSSSDGSVTLATDSRTGTSYSWDPGEIIAEDYRLLFGSATAISQSPNSLNTDIVAPTGQAGLRDWFLTGWA